MGSRMVLKDVATSTVDVFLIKQQLHSTTSTINEQSNEASQTEAPQIYEEQNVSQQPNQFQSINDAEILSEVNDPEGMNDLQEYVTHEQQQELCLINTDADTNRNVLEVNDEEAVSRDDSGWETPKGKLSDTGIVQDELTELLSNAAKELEGLPHSGPTPIPISDKVDITVCQVDVKQDKKNVAVASPSLSEGPSIYYDALETQEPEGGDVVVIKKRSKKRNKKKWCCCCCQKSNGGNGETDDNDNAFAQSQGFLGACSGGGGLPSKRSNSTAVKTSSKAITVNIAYGDLKSVEKNGQRRKRVPDRPDKNMSLWSVLKHALSKDISRNPLPVNFSEPLSMLQRLAEDYEYSDLLDHASLCTDQWEQMCYVVAFGVASYSNTAIRLWKPFNPILGETYEWDRMEDLGWRYISEQVSHHPPVSATHCEGAAGWICWQDLTMHSKWHMNTCDFTPSGLMHLVFKESGHHYTWKKVTTVVHNLIMGRLWVDQEGDMIVTNHKTFDNAKIQFIPSSGRQQRQVVGTVVNSKGLLKYNLKGAWDDHLSVTLQDPPSKNAPAKLIWKSRPPPPHSEKYYNLTEFACQLNEVESGVAPTDSRVRSDQRMMEEGAWDEANAEKKRLEDKQRDAEKRLGMVVDDDAKSRNSANSASSMLLNHQTYVPTWFLKVPDEVTSTLGYKYMGKYWEAKQKNDWTMCPNIF